MDQTINSFTGDYEFLSLEYPCEIKYEGIVFKNAATLLYALKSNDVGSMRKYARLSPFKARQKASKENNAFYDANFEDYVRKVCKLKFSQHENLVNKLKNTYPFTLINILKYNDTKLGLYMGKGKNILGKVLTDIREELQNH